MLHHVAETLAQIEAEKRVIASLERWQTRLRREAERRIARLQEGLPQETSQGAAPSDAAFATSVLVGGCEDTSNADPQPERKAAVQLAASSESGSTGATPGNVARVAGPKPAELPDSKSGETRGDQRVLDLVAFSSEVHRG